MPTSVFRVCGSPTGSARPHDRRLVPPDRQAGRAPPRASRRRLRRPVRVAARQVRSRGDRVPGGRERLHRADHRSPGAAAAEDLRRDQGPHQGDRPVGAHPPRRLVVLQPQFRGQAVRRALPLPDKPIPTTGRRRSSTRTPRSPANRCCSTRTSEARGPRLLRARRRHGQRRRPHAGLLGRRRRRRAIHVAVQGLTDRPALRRRDRRHRRRRDLGRRQPHHLLHDGRRRVAAGHRVAAPHRCGPARREGLSRTRRAVLARGRPHPQRQVPDHRRGQRRDIGDPVRRRRRRRRRVRPGVAAARARRVLGRTCRRRRRRPFPHPAQRRRRELHPRRGAGERPDRDPHAHRAPRRCPPRRRRRVRRTLGGQLPPRGAAADPALAALCRRATTAVRRSSRSNPS